MSSSSTPSATAGATPSPARSHTLSVGYLALTRGAGEELLGSHWSPWYAYFPWEDWREGKPDILCRARSSRGSRSGPSGRRSPMSRSARSGAPSGCRIGFGIDGGWDEEKVLERYELLYEAGLVAEAERDGRPAAEQWADLPELGRPMEFDHRRILATALGRLRGKLKYRPVVFELLPPEFTLYDLQQTVEAISGTLLHKQNFRRLVEKGGLVEATGNVSTETGGRPAQALSLPPRGGAGAPRARSAGQGRQGVRQPSGAKASRPPNGCGPSTLGSWRKMTSPFCELAARHCGSGAAVTPLGVGEIDKAIAGEAGICASIPTALPPDNPFVGQAGARPEIWSYGHRNPQGGLRSQDRQTVRKRARAEGW